MNEDPKDYLYFSLILRTATRLLVPLMLLFSIFVLLRGHSSSGGGFIGGLVAAGAFALYAMAFGTSEARHALTVDPRGLIVLGWTLALTAALIPVVLGENLLTGLWTTIHLSDRFSMEVGTPVVFDFGVFFVVTGISITIIFSLEELGKRLFPREP